MYVLIITKEGVQQLKLLAISLCISISLTFSGDKRTQSLFYDLVIRAPLMSGKVKIHFGNIFNVHSKCLIYIILEAHLNVPFQV